MHKTVPIDNHARWVLLHSDLDLYFRALGYRRLAGWRARCPSMVGPFNNNERRSTRAHSSITDKDVFSKLDMSRSPLKDARNGRLLSEPILGHDSPSDDEQAMESTASRSSNKRPASPQTPVAAKRQRTDAAGNIADAENGNILEDTPTANGQLSQKTPGPQYRRSSSVPVFPSLPALVDLRTIPVSPTKRSRSRSPTRELQIKPIPKPLDTIQEPVASSTRPQLFSIRTSDLVTSQSAPELGQPSSALSSLPDDLPSALTSLRGSISPRADPDSPLTPAPQSDVGMAMEVDEMSIRTRKSARKSTEKPEPENKDAYATLMASKGRSTAESKMAKPGPAPKPTAKGKLPAVTKTAGASKPPAKAPAVVKKKEKAPVVKGKEKAPATTKTKPEPSKPPVPATNARATKDKIVPPMDKVNVKGKLAEKAVPVPSAELPAEPTRAPSRIKNNMKPKATGKPAVRRNLPIRSSNAAKAEERPVQLEDVGPVAGPSGPQPRVPTPRPVEEHPPIPTPASEPTALEVPVLGTSPAQMPIDTDAVDEPMSTIEDTPSQLPGTQPAPSEQGLPAVPAPIGLDVQDEVVEDSLISNSLESDNHEVVTGPTAENVLAEPRAVVDRPTETAVGPKLVTEASTVDEPEAAVAGASKDALPDDTSMTVESPKKAIKAGPSKRQQRGPSNIPQPRSTRSGALKKKEQAAEQAVQAPRAKQTLKTKMSPKKPAAEASRPATPPAVSTSTTSSVSVPKTPARNPTASGLPSFARPTQSSIAKTPAAPPRSPTKPGPSGLGAPSAPPKTPAPPKRAATSLGFSSGGEMDVFSRLQAKMALGSGSPVKETPARPLPTTSHSSAASSSSKPLSSASQTEIRRGHAWGPCCREESSGEGKQDYSTWNHTWQPSQRQEVTGAAIL
ncbi:hypothetical protein CYLTODRAFT_146020 [Cylindrobasidium torrendii FP15055 ss-10]|uniref:Uncharacterized protein n=1 Tax=Cylindrobasidium torrendii FP15055 ss-10 TaxID=1314674 RepID=A0A0D7B143_9AGAR|nr:hypothetical protein CYLTODRAFT_146020 [Cylindrobasidium torrendii FP15055 ss-10]